MFPRITPQPFPLYTKALSMMIGDAASSGVLTAPRDGKMSWTAHADLAAAAAAILTRAQKTNLAAALMGSGGAGSGTRGRRHAVEWLSNNGSAYIAEAGQIVAALRMCLAVTPVRSPESNGIAEAFVRTLRRDYGRLVVLLDVRAATQLLPSWFDDYVTFAPHTGLKMLSLREFHEPECLTHPAACPVKQGALQRPTVRCRPDLAVSNGLHCPQRQRSAGWDLWNTAKGSGMSLRRVTANLEPSAARMVMRPGRLYSSLSTRYIHVS